jgi:hypothetical protein
LSDPALGRDGGPESIGSDGGKSKGTGRDGGSERESRKRSRPPWSWEEPREEGEGALGSHLTREEEEEEEVERAVLAHVLTGGLTPAVMAELVDFMRVPWDAREEGREGRKEGKVCGGSAGVEERTKETRAWIERRREELEELRKEREWGESRRKRRRRRRRREGEEVDMKGGGQRDTEAFTTGDEEEEKEGAWEEEGCEGTESVTAEREVVEVQGEEEEW